MNKVVQVIKIVQKKKIFQINQLDLGNKIFQINKLYRGNKDTSSKQDSSINLKNIDLDCFMEKFSELYNNKIDSNEKAQAAREHAKEILDE